MHARTLTLSTQKPLRRPDLPICLPNGRTIKDQADACRTAALAFVWCARAWGKRELALWLAGPYMRAVAARRPIERRRLAEGQRVEDTSVREILVRSHGELIELLRRSWAWRDGDMRERGLVIRVADEEQGVGWAPVSAPHVTLVERVHSLFVADCLTRPQDYARFRVCAGCGGATFDQHNEHAETCAG
jgi:hypothetical protein